MRVVQIHGPNDVRVDEAPKPLVGPHDVLLKIDACGVCGSDLTFAKYGFQREGGEPWPLGHEASGTVVEAGSQVEGIAPGLRAVINPMGAYDNIIGNGGSEGAFADYLLVRNARLNTHLLPLPAGMSAERAALVEPLAVALHGVNQGKIAADDKVVVFGAGPIGLGAVFWLKRRGVKSIVSVDLSEARLDIARKLGATATINPATTDFQAALTELHGAAGNVLGLPTAATDVYIDMAGSTVALQAILSAARFQARLVITAVYAQPVSLDLQTMLLKELSLQMAVGYPTELPDVLSTLAQVSDAEIEPYVTHRFAFGEFANALETAKQPTSGKVMVYFD
jgi:2-desacetyl-2-hydroxyethyl bacteriochlorophyllide A dehydrogenase